MKIKSITLNIVQPYRLLTLLGGALLSLPALSAHGQTVIRRSVYSRQTTFANGQTMTLYSPYATYPNYAAIRNYALNRSASAVGSVNPNVPSANSATGAGGTPPGPPPQTPTPDAVTAQYAGSSQLLVQWTGNSSGVRQVTLGVFDAEGNKLASQTLTQMPVGARFPITADIAYYGAQVQYANGKVTTTYQPLQ